MMMMISSNITSRDIEECLNEQLKLFSLFCTKLKTKNNTNASFHISVQENDFPLITSTGVWSHRALVAPFYRKLRADQIYSSENWKSNRSHSPRVCDPPVPYSVTTSSSDGARGGRELLRPLNGCT
jgi:hypothetical protein